MNKPSHFFLEDKKFGLSVYKMFTKPLQLINTLPNFVSRSKYVQTCISDSLLRARACLMCCCIILCKYLSKFSVHAKRSCCIILCKHLIKFQDIQKVTATVFEVACWNSQVFIKSQYLVNGEYGSVPNSFEKSKKWQFLTPVK